MKFNEKLIELRKKEGLSQEELGYKLNVTRQTVSKWELGQTTPEMEKLVEMSKIFNISVDELINETQTSAEVNPIIEDQPIEQNNSKEKRTKNIIIVALIVVVILIVIKIIPSLIGLSFFNKVTDGMMGDTNTEQTFIERFFSIFDKIFDNIEKDLSGDSEFDKKSFNTYFELINGTNRGTVAEEMLDHIVTNNKTKERKITVKYAEIETQDPEEIRNLKKEIKSNNSYEISFDYDENGYINKSTIEDVTSEKDEEKNEEMQDMVSKIDKVISENGNVISQFENETIHNETISKIDISRFNSVIEMYSGTKVGSQVTFVLDKIITSNKTNERKITVKYNGTETQDENEIKNIKRKMGTFDNYEVTLEYDADGFINKAIIEKL